MNSNVRLSTHAHTSHVEPSAVLRPLSSVLNFLFLLLSLTLLLALAPLASRAATFGPYTYTVSAGQATITDFNESYSGALSITNKLGGYPVTSIGEYAFYFCSALTSVTIPSGVTTISGFAFHSCDALTSVTIPNSVTTIGAAAFASCSKLTSVTIPASVTSIGDFLFRYCYSLASITIPAGVTTIGVCAFESTALTSVTIPAGVTTIGDMAFSYCYYLTSVTTPAGVTTIGDGAFASCTGLTNITVSSSNPAYASLDGVLFNKAFTTLIQYPAGKAGAYTIRASVTTIGDLAFSSCYQLTSVLFQGNPPTLGGSFVFDSTPSTLYYLPAFASNWPATLASRPTRLWNPTIQRDTSFGFASGLFGFNISGTPDMPVKVEATTNLASGVWTLVVNANLNSSGTLSFTDPASTSLPARYYRIVWP